MRTVTDAVAQAGRMVLLAVGYDAVTMERVAEGAGLDLDLVLHYVPDRDALVALVIERWHVASESDERLLRLVLDEVPDHLVR